MSSQLITAKSELLGKSVRHDTLDGRDHLVVPVVMIVDGVMNNALVTHEEYAKYVSSWDGRPVPVMHPQKNGQYVSANSADIIQRNVIGTVFNSRLDANKLKAELWIDVEKAERLGHGAVVNSLESGGILEVSTGYFSDKEKKAGSFNGQSYVEVHRNIRPDHLAILPNEEGACSVMDGCGTRVNKISPTAAALGQSTNCKCNGGTMPLDKETAEGLKANGMNDEQIKVFSTLTEDQQALFLPVVNADKPDLIKKNEDDEEDDEEEVKKAPAVNASQLESLVANAIAKARESDKHAEIAGQLSANESCIYTAEDMKGMSVNALTKYAKSIRPVDYTGHGAVVAHSASSVVEPLNINRGLAAMIKSEGAK